MGDDKDELLELAFVIICNVDQGGWDNQSQEWKDAARRWQDRYHSQKPALPPEESRR